MMHMAHREYYNMAVFQILCGLFMCIIQYFWCPFWANCILQPMSIMWIVVGLFPRALPFSLIADIHAKILIPMTYLFYPGWTILFVALCAFDDMRPQEPEDISAQAIYLSCAHLLKKYITCEHINFQHNRHIEAWTHSWDVVKQQIQTSGITVQPHVCCDVYNIHPEDVITLNQIDSSDIITPLNQKKQQFLWNGRGFVMMKNFHEWIPTSDWYTTVRHSPAWKDAIQDATQFREPELSHIVAEFAFYDPFR